jgi:hypothetical protein
MGGNIVANDPSEINTDQPNDRVTQDIGSRNHNINNMD